MSRLLELERIIESGQSGFYQTGKSLREVRDEQLYRELMFESFNAYLKSRWDMGRSQAYRLIEASRVIDNLSPIGDVLPENEAQLRPLTSLTLNDQRRIWRDFLSSGKDLKACNIRSFVRASMGDSHIARDRTGIISAGYKQAVMEMLTAIRLAQQDGWVGTSREAGMFWLQVMKDKIASK